MANEERKVPAPLVLPFGKLFFGYTYKPYDPSKDTKKVEPEDGAEVSLLICHKISIAFHFD